jgi:ubiquitin fusion degradation protein 1
MQVLQVETGDMLQIKSTDLPSGSFIKLQPQSTNFLDISDPKAVLENVFRNFSCMTKGDVFSFEYNDETFDIAVLETKPESNKHAAISVVETDLEVDFAPPIGYEEPKRPSGTSTPGSGRGGLPSGGTLHNQGTMAQAINYASIAPESKEAVAGAKAVSSHFLTGGQKLNTKKGSKAPTPKASTPVEGQSTNTVPLPVRKTNGPQPLRLPPNKLFFGYTIKPVRKDGEKPPDQDDKPKFQGQGQSLRGGKSKPPPVEQAAEKKPEPNPDAGGRTLRGKK